MGGRFTSERERRLWFLTAAVILGIYSTLLFAQIFSDFFTNQRYVDSAFMGGMILVGGAILIQGLRARPATIEIVAFAGIVAVYWLVLVRMSSTAERSHLIEYGVVALFVYEALKERASQGRHVPLPALLAIGATSILGVIDECIQAILPDRVFAMTDILFNVLAAVMAVSAVAALDWAGRRMR